MLFSELRKFLGFLGQHLGQNSIEMRHSPLLKNLLNKAHKKKKFGNGKIKLVDRLSSIFDPESTQKNLKFGRS